MTTWRAFAVRHRIQAVYPILCRDAGVSVPTLGGEVAAEAPGITLMPEHIFVLEMEVEQNYQGRWDEETRITGAIAKLAELSCRGDGTLVDLTVLGLRLSVPRFLELVPHVDRHMVRAVGLYAFDDVPAFFRYRGPERLIAGPGLLKPFFVADLTTGIGNTGVRAASPKYAPDQQGVPEGVERVRRAVARAHRETGAPISTHTHVPSRRSQDQFSLFDEEGVDLDRVVIGYCDDTTDLFHLEKLIERGAEVGMDRFGLDLRLSFEDRVDTVVRLCEGGYAERIVLSQDASCFTHSFDVEAKQSLLPNCAYTHLFDAVLRRFRDRGVTQAKIDQMLVTNPRAILAGIDR
jgi:phosphotriesterase-related protein